MKTATNIISLIARRAAVARSKMAQGSAQELKRDEAIVSTTVSVDGEYVHIAFSKAVSGLHLERTEAYRLGLMLLAAHDTQ